MKAGFTIDFADPLEGDEQFKYALSSNDGDGGELGLQDQYFIAYNEVGVEIYDGVQLIGDVEYGTEAKTDNLQIVD